MRHHLRIVKRSDRCDVQREHRGRWAPLYAGLPDMAAAREWITAEYGRRGTVEWIMPPGAFAQYVDITLEEVSR